MTNSQLKDALGLVDLKKISEKVLEECQLCKHIPQEFITEAALALCGKLRNELNQQKSLTAHKPENLKKNDFYNTYKLKYPTSGKQFILVRQ